MDKIKVLHVAEAFEGGIITLLQSITNGTSDDFQHYILYNRRKRSPKEPEALFKPGIKLVQSKHLTREISPFADLAAIKELRKVYLDIKPDVVHLHSSKAGAIGRLALDGFKVPIFYSPHGYSFLMYQCSWFERKMYYIIEKILGCRPSITVAVSKGESDLAKKVSRRVIYINNGVNTEELDRLNLDFENRPPKVRICTLGRIAPQKAPEIFNRIAKALPEVKFVWIGGGELQGELTAPNIEVTGWLPTREDALEKMMSCSVYMLTSLYEGMAFSLLEAMYFKRLCIVSRIPGNIDVIENGVTGFICGEIQEYVAVIRKLLKDGIDPGMLDRARQRVVTQLNQRVMVTKYENLYRYAAGGGRSRRVIIIAPRLCLIRINRDRCVCAAERSVA